MTTEIKKKKAGTSQDTEWTSHSCVLRQSNEKINRGENKNKWGKFKEKHWITISILFLVGFTALISIVLIFNPDSETIFQRILIATGITAFIGLFMQLLHALNKEITSEKEENRKIAMIIVDVEFSRTLARGVKNHTPYKLEIVRIKSHPKNPDYQDLEIRQKVKIYSELGYDGIILRLMRPVNEKMEKSLMEVIRSEHTELILMDYDFSEAQRERIRLEERSYGFVDSNWEGTAGGCELIGKLITKKLENRTDYVCLRIDLRAPEMEDAAHYIPMKRNKHIAGIISKKIEPQGINAEYNEGDDVGEIIKALKEAKRNGTFNERDNLIIICGYDTIASRIMESVKEDVSLFSQDQEIIYIGYDGLRDSKKKSCIIDSGGKYVTIDINADEQGKQVWNCLKELFDEKNKRGQNHKHIYEQKIIHNLCENFVEYIGCEETDNGFCCPSTCGKFIASKHK